MTACLAIVIEFDQISTALSATAGAIMAVSAADWWAMLLGLGLLAAFLAGVGSDHEGPWPCETEHLVIAFHWVIVFVVWWLGAAASPIIERQGLLTALVYYPLATAMAALATAQIVGRLTRTDGWDDAYWFADLRSDRFTRLFAVQASVLAILAVVFTRGQTASATAVSSFIAALALGSVALRTGWIAPAFAGSVAWEFACAIAGLLVATQLVASAPEPRSIYAAAGLLAAAFLLWHLAGTLRRDASDRQATARRPCAAERSRGVSAGARRRMGGAFVFAICRRIGSGCRVAAGPALGRGESRRRGLGHGGRSVSGNPRSALEPPVARLSGASDDRGRVRRFSHGVSLADRGGRGGADAARLSGPGARRASRSRAAHDLRPSCPLLVA